MMRQLYNANGEWIGVEVTEVISREEAERRYPQAFAKFLSQENAES